MILEFPRATGKDPDRRPAGRTGPGVQERPDPGSAERRSTRKARANIPRVDEVRLSGFGYARANNGELHAVVFQAPRPGFYPRYQPQVDRMAQTASLRS